MRTIRSILIATVLTAVLLGVGGAALTTPHPGTQEGRDVWIVFEPPSGNYQTATLQVTVGVCSDFPVDWEKLDLTYNDVSVEETFTLDDGSVSGCTEEYETELTGQVSQAINSENVLNLIVWIVGDDGIEESATYTRYQPQPPVVTPANGSVNATVHTPQVATFSVENPDDVSRTYNLLPVCSGHLTCGSAPPSVEVGALQTANVAVNYTTGRAVGTQGTIELWATLDLEPYPADTGRLTVIGTMTSAPNPGPPPTSRALIARDECLTMPAGTDGAYQCGDLQLAHALPGVRTLGVQRDPALVYNSAHAQPTVLIPYELTMNSVPGGHGLPDSVVVSLSLNGNPLGQRGSFPGSQWTMSSTRRILVGLDSSLSTGVHSYRLDFELKYLGESPFTPSYSPVSGEFIVVNRRQTPYGAGWWIGGVEQLYTIPGGSDRLWIGGDGSARVYRFVAGSDSTWRTDFLHRPDVLTKSAGRYARHLPHGGQVWFNATGQHVATVNRLGFKTDLTYSSSAIDAPLVRIAVPKPWGAMTADTFYYSGGPQRLDSVRSPGPSAAMRVTRATITGGQLRAVQDPNGKTVEFGYAHADTHRVIWRENRLDHKSRYFYDRAGKLREARVDMPGSDTIIVTYQPAESRGVRGATGIDTALVVDSVMTVVDGPRIDLADITRFWVNRRGAPTRILNALNGLTLVKREDPLWPSLVTELVVPSGFVTRAEYDATRGNILRSIAMDPYGPTSPDDTTRYSWDTTWDFVTTIRRPEGDSITFTYDPSTGHRLSQRPGGSAAHAVTFAYVPNGSTQGLLAAIVAAGSGSATEQMSYDAFGNVSGVQVASGSYTQFFSDAIGRTAKIMRQIVPGVSTYQVDTLHYDAMSRVWRTMTSGPTINGVPAQSFAVETTFDFEGRPIRVDRYPDAADPFTMVTTEWEYDRAGRMIAAIAPDGAVDSTFYDRVGNADSIRTRNGHRLTMTYDALNRLTQRTVPAVGYPVRIDTVFGFPDSIRTYPTWPNSGDSILVPANVATFSYDAMGNVLSATNRDARVHRAYHENGLLKSETDSLRTYADTGAGGNFTSHIYTLAYTYDRNGRRTALQHPTNLAPTGSTGTTTYEYEEPYFGALTKVTGLLSGDEYRFTYDVRGQVDTVIYPGNVRQRLTYDHPGRLVREVIRVPLNVPYPFSDSILRRANYSYDAMDRLTLAVDSARYWDIFTMKYSGLGHLAHFRRQSLGRTSEDSGTVQTENEDSTRFDGLGNILRTQSVTTNFVGSHPNVDAFDPAARVYTYDDHLRLASVIGSRDGHYEYDAGGNVVYERTEQELFLEVNWTSRRAYYAADGALWGAETKVLRSNTDFAKRVFEEYRYDALGRRILMRSRHRCESDAQADRECELRPGWIRRTVWDGVNELYEMQAPGGDGDGAVIESDTGVTSWLGGELEEFDFTPEFGRVAYITGVGIDRPLGLTRMYYRDVAAGAWSPFTIVPLWNVRGQVETSYFNYGSSQVCVTGPTRCVRKHWTLNPFAFAVADEQKRVWHGSVVDGKLDRTGTMYRRNRYYDPATGRFTQEDPIGLTGGLNLYGYTNGDPVNFSDPFGLCPEPTEKDDMICIAFFISKGSVWGSKGDGRGYTPTSDPQQSRLYFHIDPRRPGVYGGTVNPSCHTDGKCTNPSRLNIAIARVNEDGTIDVKVRAYNSMEPFAPAIDASLRLRPNDEGSYDVNGSRDQMPSLEIYHWRNGIPSTVFQAPERSPLWLFPFMPNQWLWPWR